MPTWPTIRSARPRQPTIDYAASFDNLDIMEKVMRHFYLRALIEERMGASSGCSRASILLTADLSAWAAQALPAGAVLARRASG